MTIVYASAALFVVTLVYLGVSGSKAKKGIKTSLNSLHASISHLQKNIGETKNEAIQLSQTQQKIKQDMNEKKEKMNEAFDACKNLGTTLQELK